MGNPYAHQQTVQAVIAASFQPRSRRFCSSLRHTIDEQTFHYPINRVILPDERPIYMQEACQKIKNPQKNEDFLFFILFSRLFCKNIPNRHSLRGNRRAEMHTDVQECTPMYNFNTPVSGASLCSSTGCPESHRGLWL